MVSETLILGGGLAGGAAASLLARAGRPVRLLERETGPHHKVCGEFLSAEAHQDLMHIGLDPLALGAVPIDRIRLARGSREVTAALPFSALGISRKVLDEALLDHAARRGAVIERGIRITRIGTGTVSTSKGERLADTMLLATGKHDVRGTHRLAPRAASPYIGFKLHFRPGASARQALARTIELVFFASGYAGVQLVSANVMNLCLIVRRDRFAEIGGSWDALLGTLMRETALARRLDEAEPLLAKPLTIANLPYGYVCRRPGAIYRLGDQAAMTASLTGDGMAIALRSAAIASECVLAGLPPHVCQQRITGIAAGQVRRAMTLQHIGEVPAALGLALPVLRLWPGLLGKAAAMTRLPASIGSF